MPFKLNASIFTNEQIQEMRNWIAECDQDEDEEFSDDEVVNTVRKYYDGGLAAFDFGNGITFNHIMQAAEYDSSFPDNGNSYMSDALDHSIAHMV